jgi:o-succinylbenzoate synthase
MKASFRKYTLEFRQPSGTSRGVYTTRDIWLLSLSDGVSTGIGECAPLPDLSVENPKRMGVKLLQVCEEIDYFMNSPEELNAWPSIRFGLETAMGDLKNGGNQMIFTSAFTRGEEGIPINGLIWMGTPELMREQIKSKLEAGFRCLKLKIGALDFETEYDLLRSIRKEYSPEDITLRVDANGAYSYKTALNNLKRLSELGIHSIEQPIEAGRWQEMAELCSQSPIPIGLDEELIGVTSEAEMKKLLETIKPQYLILKPSLHGGFALCEKWIENAALYGSGWWITSALESNIGLNAIAQWTFQLNTKGEQGLGTGQLFSNNFDTKLQIKGDRLWHCPNI